MKDMQNNKSFQELQSMMTARSSQLEGNPDVYWDCNGQPVWTKYKAMQNLSAGQPTQFYCFDQQWAAADWTMPTNIAVDQLMIDRALEIRRNNDFVRVAYSGGADSHSILTAFRLAGVAPDEIVFWTALAEHKVFFNNNFEIERAVIPYLSILREWFPKTKIRHLNYDFGGKLNAFKLLHPDNIAFEITAGLRSISLVACVTAFEELTIGPGITTISGSDKPRLDYINGNWYAWISDLGSAMVWGRGNEGFFQHKDPTMFIKQCHDMKHFLIKQLSTINRQNVFAFQASKADLATRRDINHMLGRHLPFNDSVNSRKLSKRPPQGLGELHSKAALLYRALKRIKGGPEFLSAWEDTKQQFKTETGYCPTVAVFGKFYNLDTGEIHSVDELFPTGWNSND